MVFDPSSNLFLVIDLIKVSGSFRKLKKSYAKTQGKAYRPEFASADLGAAVPHVIARQADVLLA